MNILDQSIGQLARSIPGATGVFHHYHLDFCCGGHKSLRQSLSNPEQVEQIVSALERLSAQQDCEQVLPPVADGELIDHILERYHQVHREQLPELIRLARRVESVHGDRPDCPTGLADHLQAMAQELESHMQKEEQILFPMIRHGASAMAVHPVAVMRHEHDDHGEALAGILQLTHDITPPRDACNTWRALYLGLQAFKTDLMDHIHLENNILFERIDGHFGSFNHG